MFSSHYCHTRKTYKDCTYCVACLLTSRWKTIVNHLLLLNLLPLDPRHQKPRFITVTFLWTTRGWRWGGCMSRIVAKMSNRDWRHLRGSCNGGRKKRPLGRACQTHESELGQQKGSRWLERERERTDTRQEAETRDMRNQNTGRGWGNGHREQECGHGAVRLVDTNLSVTLRTVGEHL